MNPGQTLLILIAVYATLGLAFAIPFLIKGAHTLQPNATIPTRVKLLLALGAIAVWPALLIAWARATHRKTAT